MTLIGQSPRGSQSSNQTVKQAFTLPWSTQAVPLEDTSYVCKWVTLPHYYDYQIVASMPTIDKPRITKQMILFGCDRAVNGIFKSNISMKHPQNISV